MAEHETGSVPGNRRGACFSGITQQTSPVQEHPEGAGAISTDRLPAVRPETVPTEDGIAPLPDTFPTEDRPALCPVCGNPAEGFGSFPIAEGLLCGDCAGKLSEWFPCRPTTTAAQIRAQLAYREENRAAAGAFRTTKILWSHPCIALDAKAGTFQISSQQGRTANPDILSCRQILGCQVEIAEQRRELFRSGREHYRPRRYEYRFEIYVRVLVAHPWFHEMRFRLHDCPIVVSDRMVQASTAGKVVKSPEYQRYKRAGEDICGVLRKAMEQSREAERREAADSTAVTGSADGTVADVLPPETSADGAAADVLRAETSADGAGSRRG